MEDIDNGNVYIIDASVVLAWLLPNEIYKRHANAILELYRQKKIEIIAPAILPYEITNGIKTAVLRKRVTKELAYEQIDLYQDLEIKLVAINGRHVLEIAIEENISAYDSAYVSLMTLQKKPLITADKKLYTILLQKKKAVKWIEEFKGLDNI